MTDLTASFCISTYKRPALLQQQLELLASQTFTNFEVVISDNDPEKSAEAVVVNMKDHRFKYFSNDTNLGMVKSFNKSIERANGDFVVMVTDDDPVMPEMLTELFRVVQDYPSFPIYCGCVRTNKQPGAIEAFSSDDFLFQLLHPGLTPNFLWSSCLLKREVALLVGGMPDYGSPHLADHALLALCSRYGGGVFINKMYSDLTSHDKNFSKSNFKLYYTGGDEFYRLMTTNFSKSVYIKQGTDALLLHLKIWFLSNSFSLRRYFTYQNKNSQAVNDIATWSRKILSLPFMRYIYPKYIFKLIMFYLKYPYNQIVHLLGKENYI